MSTATSRRLSWVVAVVFVLAGPLIGWSTARLASRVEREQVGGRRWLLTGQSPQEYVSAFITRGPPLLGVGVTLLWALVGGLVVLLVARARDVAFRDITAARQTERELRASLKQLEDLRYAVEQTADAIMITDPDGIIRYVNPAFETVTGFSRAEAIGETPRLLRSGQQPTEYYETLWKTLVAGDVFRGSPINRRKNGDLYRAEQTITPIKDSEGRTEHFVSVMQDVTDRIRAEQQEIEMRYASAVQRRLYPTGAPVVAGLDIAAATFPALATCGDYYDFLSLPDGSLGIVIGDVSGHGLGPALIMVETRACLHFLAESCATVGDILTRTNATLYEDLDDERYVALIMAKIDQAAGRLVYANAGHTSAYHLDGRGHVKAVMESSGPPAGVLPGVVYGIVENPPLEDGDVVVFLTDGITETEDPSGNAFGAEAAIEAIRANIDSPAWDLIQQVRKAVRDFAHGAPQADDITIIVCKKLNRSTL